jgi:acyl-[acyl-carrier-protein]-phospholipid O-acyltransferase/long-chain-fatty-acid--[acyl-carrier-protein] ligase
MAQQPFVQYDSIRNRTFYGLLIAEFLAAFNDQCIHASAMFFAIQKHALNESQAIALMPILFYAPWALFCTLSAYFADRYSKRTSLIFWKVAEVGITALALLGFWIGATTDSPFGHKAGAWTVMVCVFLMGTHSAFYVPNKYGCLPEIFKPHALPRANGLVESTSFLAIILGTATGGALSFVFHGEEYYIGMILVVLALIGTLTSLLIEHIPPADPTRRFPGLLPWKLYQPFVKYLTTMLRSRPLHIALTNIAFFTFLVAFMRSTMYMHGQSQIPRWDEFTTSMVVAVVAFGVGLGSPLAGFLSRGKVELGLVPLGAFGMIVFSLIAGIFIHRNPVLITCLVLLGFSSGFYIVPLYTLLQHRAPKGSKGASIASSNVINVTGAILASLLFFGLVQITHRIGLAPEVRASETFQAELLKIERNAKTHQILSVELRTADGETARLREGPVNEGEEDWEDDPFPVFSSSSKGNILEVEDGLRPGARVRVSQYLLRDGELSHYRVDSVSSPVRPFYNNEDVPRALFIGASLMMLLSMGLFSRNLPDFIARSLLWVRMVGRKPVRVGNQQHLPTEHAAILVSNCRRFEDAMRLQACIDRRVRTLLTEEQPPQRKAPIVRFFARLAGMIILPAGRTTDAPRRRAVEAGVKALRGNNLVVVSAPASEDGAEFEEMLGGLQAAGEFPVVPVYYGAPGPPENGEPNDVSMRQVVFGEELPPGVSTEEIRKALQELAAQPPVQVVAAHH